MCYCCVLSYHNYVAVWALLVGVYQSGRLVVVTKFWPWSWDGMVSVPTATPQDGRCELVDHFVSGKLLTVPVAPVFV